MVRPIVYVSIGSIVLRVLNNFLLMSRLEDTHCTVYIFPMMFFGFERE
jgi:hypothetical protein